MTAQDLIDREGMRDDLLVMAERADSEYERVQMTNMYGLDSRSRMALKRYANELEEHRGACLDAISKLSQRRSTFAGDVQ